jgi:hypothetical protein
MVSRLPLSLSQIVNFRRAARGKLPNKTQGGTAACRETKTDALPIHDRRPGGVGDIIIP